MFFKQSVRAPTDNYSSIVRLTKSSKISENMTEQKLEFPYEMREMEPHEKEELANLFIGISTRYLYVLFIHLKIIQKFLDTTKFNNKNLHHINLFFIQNIELDTFYTKYSNFFQGYQNYKIYLRIAEEFN